MSEQILLALASELSSNLQYTGMTPDLNCTRWGCKVPPCGWLRASYPSRSCTSSGYMELSTEEPLSTHGMQVFVFRKHR